MFQLVESIKILNARVYNILAHNERASHAYKSLFGIEKFVNLRKLISVQPPYDEGLVKCRIVYNQQDFEVTYQHYTIKKINSVKIIHDNKVDYSFKLLNRAELDVLYAQRGIADDIIIIKDGLVTDAYYYNLVFEKNKQFYTPKSPLLHGTQRSKLLLNKTIAEKIIRVKDIVNYEKIHFINAMTPLTQLTIRPEQIIY